MAPEYSCLRARYLRTGRFSVDVIIVIDVGVGMVSAGYDAVVAICVVALVLDDAATYARVAGVWFAVAGLLPRRDDVRHDGIDQRQ